MANLAASLSVMVAVALPWGQVAVRLAFGVVLNLLVYLTNDAYDIEVDLASPRKDHEKARFLDEHRPSIRLAQGLLVALLFGIATVWSRGLVVTASVAGALCWAYSARLKRLAGWDVVSVLALTVAGTMLAFPLDSVLGWCLVGQLGLFSVCFQTLQMLRDHDDDRAFGLRTTAVRLGIRRTTGLQRVLMVVSAAYAMAMVHRWVGLALLVAPLLPMRRGGAEAHWNRVRGVFGVAWLAMVAWIVETGGTDGLLVRVAREQVVGWLTAVR